MRSVTFLLLNTLAFSALSAEEPSDFERGLRTLLELELDKFEFCLEEGKTNCDDSELDNFLHLLDEGRPVKMGTPAYPRNALSSGISAEVIVQITVTKLGEVVRGEATSCVSGKGPVSLKHKWEQGGRYCKAFRRKAERAVLNRTYSPVISVEVEEYSRYTRVTFEVVDEQFAQKSQLVEIKESDIRKISELKREKAWLALREFVEEKQDESPVFIFYLATAQAGLGYSDEVVATLESFLQIAKNKYFHYGAQAASTVIDTRYAQENDVEVVAAGDSYNLMHYYKNGTQISKYKIGLSLMKFASSLTFVRPQQLGRSLSILSDLKQHIGLVKDRIQRQDLEGKVDAQLENIRAQLSRIGARNSG
jgi:hypothetical protein